MSLVDYGQTAEDHQSLLILVRHTGSHLPAAAFNRVWDRIRGLSMVHVQGQNRNVAVRYKRGYPKENNEWGDFQAHRRVLGLVAIGKCVDHEEFADLFENYKKVKEEYSSTIINSRLIIFGMNTDGSPLNPGQQQQQQQQEQQQQPSSRPSQHSPSHSRDHGTSEVPSGGDPAPETSSGGEGTEPRPSSAETKEASSQAVEFQSNSTAEQTDSEGGGGSGGSPVPSSGASSIHHDGNSGVGQGKKGSRSDVEATGRPHSGSLTKESTGSEVVFYPGLEHCSDLEERLKEFVTSLFFVLEGKRLERTFERNDRLMLLCAPFEKKDYVGVDTDTKSFKRKCMGRLRKHLGDLCLQAGLPGEAILHYQTALDLLRTVNDFLWMGACYEGLCSASVVLTRAHSKPGPALRRNQSFSVKRGQSSPDLKNKTPGGEGIQRYSTLAWLYGQIGFRRKEAFFRRVAAMQCVSPGSNPAWQQCYHLLLQALQGYSICLDPRDIPKGHHNGWPVIQHRVLHELVYTARRMGNPQLAVRHSTLLLHTMYPHLTGEQQKEAVTGLETLTAKCQGLPQPLSTDTGLILPPIHLTTLPTVRCFKLLSPPAHLVPVKTVTRSDESSSIFIYTPLSLGHSDRKAQASAVDFEWVSEDTCEVQLQVFNPLSTDLRLLHMGLLTEGVEVEVLPVSPVIPAMSSHTVTLTAKPTSPGQLSVLGYTTQVFGVRSHCRLRDVPSVTAPYYKVEVVPALPQVSLACSLPKAATFASSTLPEGVTVVANATSTLYAGQSQDCVITLHNQSSHPVTSLSLRLDARNDVREYTEKMFQWSDENIQSQLPLQPGAQLCIAVCLYAHSDFLLPPVTSPDVSPSSASSRSHTDNAAEKGTQTVEAALCVEYSGGPGGKAGYCRRCALAVSVDILPSLYITNWDVLPAFSSSKVTLVLDLLNVSSQPTDIQCDVSSPDPPTPISVQPQQCRRVAVTIPRVSFPEQDQSEKFESRIPVKYRAWRAPDFHSQALSSFVHIEWTMSEMNVKGKVGVDYLKWTEDQLDSIRQSDVSWEVLVNSQHYTAPDLMTFPSSEPVTVDVTLSSAKDLQEGVTLIVSPAQEGGQGEGRQALDPDMYLCLGSSTASVPKLGPDSCVHHRCSFLFLVAGRYQFHISSCTPHRHGNDPNSTVAMTWTCLPVPQFSVSG